MALLVSLLAGFACALALHAQPARAADAVFRNWLETVIWPEAAAQGVSRATFDAALANYEPDRSLPDLVLPERPRDDSRKGQAEFQKTPAEYLSEKSFVWLNDNGRKFYAANAALLNGVEKRLGVDRHIILAIFGRETAFGTYKLPHNAIKVLATQAYLGRRKEYFHQELILGLKMLEERHVTLADMTASWAGATGLGQFMPSDFYNYRYDYDGDGRYDVWHNLGDSLATTANSLVKNGWQKGKTWGYEVRAPKGLDCTLEGAQGMKPLRAWLAMGLTRTGNRQFGQEQLDDKMFLLRPAGNYGPAFLMTPNFLVIKTYNMADLYVLFVGHLADRLAGGGPFEGQWSPITMLPQADIEDMQNRLAGLGYDMGKVDGKVGAKTRLGVGLYQKKVGLPLDCWPSAGVLAHLRGQPTPTLHAPSAAGAPRRAEARTEWRPEAFANGR